MAGFAADTGFGRLNSPLFGDTELASGMAMKAAEHTRIRREGLVLDSRCCAMARGESESTIGIEREAMFEVGVLVQLRDVGDGLRACSEGPTSILSFRERLRVMGFLLFRGDFGMADGAGLRRNELLRHQQCDRETRR